MLDNHVNELAEAGIDYADAMDRFDGHAALYERLVNVFLATDDHLDGLNAAMRANDAETATREAHSLKGAAGNLSFTALYQATSALHATLREDGMAEAARCWQTSNKNTPESAPPWTRCSKLSRLPTFACASA